METIANDTHDQYLFDPAQYGIEELYLLPQTEDEEADAEKRYFRFREEFNTEDEYLEYEQNLGFDDFELTGRNQPVLPVREMQVASMIVASSAKSYTWPPERVEGFHEPNLLVDVVERIEATGSPRDTKDAMLISMLADIRSSELHDTKWITSWGLTQHFGMLNALGAAIMTGLHPSEEALKLAANLHFGKWNKYRLRAAEDLYGVTDTEPILDLANELVSDTSTAVLSEGVPGFFGLFMHEVEFQVRYLLPGARVLSTYAEDDPDPAVRLYRHILGKVRETQDLVRSRSDEIEGMIERTLTKRVTSPHELDDFRDAGSPAPQLNAEVVYALAKGGILADNISAHSQQVKRLF